MVLKPGWIQQTLSDGNRWWRDARGWSGRDQALRAAREAPYRYVSDVLSNLVPGGLYVLRGPRRVGKSVEVKQAIEALIADGVDPRRIVHMSVDGWAADDLVRLVRASRSLLPDADRRYWFIDEITSIADGWPHRIKWLRDNDPLFHEDTVVLTGSSSSDLSESIGILAGRRGRILDSDRVLLPMGFRTFMRLAWASEAPTIDVRLRVGDLDPARLGGACYALAPWLDVLVDAWDTYLWVGGFHREVTSYLISRDVDGVFEHELLEIVHRDALRRASWSRTETSAFLRRMTKSLSSLVNHSSAARDLGVTPPTMKSRIDDLCAAFVLWPCHREKDLRLPGGRTIPLGFSTSVVRDGNGELLGAIEVFNDLTEVRRLEGEVRRMHTLAALGEMAATVAHEIRNPLGGIASFASLLERDLAAGDPNRRLVGRITEGVARLNRIVSSLLSYTRPLDLNTRPVDLAPAVEEAAAYFEVDSEGRSPGVTIRRDFPGRSCTCRLDGERFRQVVLNLLLNAAQAMPEGGTIDLRITGEARENGDWALVEVRDSGVGIADDLRGKLFTPFFTTKEDGTGLGLVTSRKIIEAHGGRLTADSVRGEGACFTIALPRQANPGRDPWRRSGSS